MSLRVINWGCVCVIVYCTVTAWGRDPASGRLSRKSIHQLVSAHSQGDSARLVELLSRAIAGRDDRSVRAVDELLAKHGLPKADDLLAKSRINLILQNVRRRVPRPSRRELQKMFEIGDGMIKKALADAKKVASAKRPPDKAPKSLDEFQKRFWVLHVLKNRVRNAYQLSRALRAQLAPRRGKFPLPKEQTLAMQASYADSQKELVQIKQKLDIRDIELRIERVKTAAGIVNKSKNNFIERLQSAFVVDVDGGILADYFRRGKAKQLAALSPKYRETGLVQLENSVKLVRQWHKPLLAKGQHLFAGMHYWMRGRYGRGTHRNGLLKGKWALRNPTAMFGLYMPQQRPRPRDPADYRYRPIPEVPRRHYHVWEFGPQVEVSGTSKTTREHGTKVTSKTEFNYFL